MSTAIIWIGMDVHKDTVMAGWALTHQGRDDDGLREMWTSLGDYERIGAVLTTTFFLALLADVHLLARRPEEGATSIEESYRTALDVARAQESRWFELRAARSLAGFLSEEGRRSEARDVLQSAYQWFAEGFETQGLREAGNLLQVLT